MLSIASTGVLPGWNTGGRYSVASNAALAVGNGVVDADITTMLGTGNFAAGAGLGFDTTVGARIYNSVIADTGAGALAVVKVGTNNLYLGGVNTYTGGTIINAGGVRITADNRLGTAPGVPTAGNIQITGGAVLQGEATFTLDANRGISLTGIESATQYGQIGVTPAGSTVTYGGVIDSPNATGDTSPQFRKASSGILNLTGTNSTFEGEVLIMAGTLQIASLANSGVASSLGKGTGSASGLGRIQIGNGNTSGTLENLGSGGVTDRQIQIGNGGGTVNTGNSTINNNGTGAISFSNPAFNLHTGASPGILRSLTLGGSNTDDNTISGAIIDNTITGAVAVIKAGSGKWILSGANTYSGGTTNNAGTLLITKAAALPGYNAASRVTVASGATLAVQAGGVGEWVSGEIDSLLGATTAAFASGSIVGLEVSTGNSFTYANDLGATEAGKSFIKSGAGALTLSGANTYGGDTVLTNGTLVADNLSAVGTGRVLLYNNSVLQLAQSLTISSNLTCTTPNGAVVDLGAAGTVLTVNSDGNNTFGGVLTNAGAFVKGGTGRMSVIGDSIHTGGTTISGGLLRLGNGTFNGTLVGAITNNAQLQFFYTAGNYTNANAISGSGSVVVSNFSASAVVVMTGTNTYTGDTRVDSGTLALTSGGVLSGSLVTVNAGAMVNNAGQIYGLIVNSGGLATGGGQYGIATNMAGGTLTPGVGGDTNYFADLTLNGDSTNIFWLGSAATHDMSVVTNSLTYGGGGPTDAPVLQLDLSSWSGSYGEQVVLYDNTFMGGAWDGTNQLFRLSDATGLFDGTLLTNGMVFTISGSGAGTFKINYDLEGAGGPGNDILLTVIPEPASINLLAMLGAAYFMRRRIHRKRGRWNI